jgi:L-threonylcarbamoyladenylate synthase
MPEIIRIDPLEPGPSALARAIEFLRTGGVAAYPTETFYGIGADAGNASAIDKIFDIKGRERLNPIPLIIGDQNLLEAIVEDVPAAAAGLIETFWPGPLTIVFRASPSLNQALTGGTGKIGVRLSSHPLARLLSNGIAGAITATSANLSGAAECVSAEEVIGSLGERIKTVIDGGKTPGGKGSTVIDVTASPPRIYRRGAVAVEAIERVIGKTA